MRGRLSLTITALLIFSFSELFCRPADAEPVKINTRLNFYSNEKNGEVMMHLPPALVFKNLLVTLKVDGNELASWKGIAGKRISLIPFEIKQDPGVYHLSAEIVASGSSHYTASCELIILQHKSNEVKTDRLTGGLIVSNRDFFPFGFYCYSPVQPTIAEEEVVKGFNMMSPYQKILPENLGARKAYMDRCAELGMKVHYNLLSVAGGGGVSSRTEGISDQEKKERLVNEIMTFMDHPALLAWYISDEPNGFNIPPSTLEEIYRTIKETDPWHPVSIVFMAPFSSALKYADALDIVMADPYPVPAGSVNQAGDVARQLRTAFEGRKPVWIVPQAFGGAEWWQREPTIQEMRTMTYQAIVNGVRGIQYFIRHGLNSFPKSTSAWNECGKMAMEIAEMTPWLMSDEKPLPVSSSTGDILVTSAIHRGRLMVIAVNRINAPRKVDIRIEGTIRGQARVLFENRTVRLNGNTITDYISAFGSQVYLIDVNPATDTVKAYRGNLMTDPGFEDMASPGVPASCYSWNEGDRGSTYFLDSREHFEGSHSLRMITPRQDSGTRLRFFPVRIEKGKSYILSIWAKTDRELNPGNKAPVFELGLGDYGKKSFTPREEWTQFVTSVTIPGDSIVSPRVNPVLRMPGKGVAWFDMIQVFEAVDIGRSINPEIKKIWDYTRE